MRRRGTIYKGDIPSNTVSQVKHGPFKEFSGVLLLFIFVFIFYVSAISLFLLRLKYALRMQQPYIIIFTLPTTSKLILFRSGDIVIRRRVCGYPFANVVMS